jgi:cystathionine beta-lyase/cystathionine gamma-synthase
VHAGEEPGDDGGLDTPIVMSSAFAFASADHAARVFQGDLEPGESPWIYGRWGNPTVAALETKLAALEGAEAACAASSGMAAITGAILAICESGDHLVAPRSMYAESARLLRERLPKLGIATTFVDATPAAYAAAITPRTRILYLETPSNPMLGIVDIAEVASMARAQNARVIVDGTFATPFAQTPLEHGADLVVHSMTKGIGGHGDVIGGVVAGSEELVAKVRDTIVKGFGGVLSPLSAWLVLRGLRTFALRQERACATAARLAACLASHPGVAVVHHPSLPGHPQHDLARRQMHAYGALLSFEVAGADAIKRGRQVLEALRIATHAVSLGDVRTLVVHPASTTHSTMPAETRQLAGIGDGLLRISCGLESADDLISDFERALG